MTNAANALREKAACAALPAWVRLASTALLIAGCATPAPPPSNQHLQPAPQVAGNVPDFATAPPLPLPPKPTAKPELYSVVVYNVEVQDLLFALARDAKINVDIHPGIGGTVTMNVLDQSLPEILDRVARQVDMRYEMNGKNLSVMPDSPYLKNYKIDYPNIQRNAQSGISTSTNVASTGTAPTGSGGGGGSGSNSSTTTINNTSNNRFWETLVANLRDLLRETDKVLPEGSSETVTEQTTQQSATPQPGATPAPATATTTTSANGKRTTTMPVPAQLSQQGNTVVRRTTFREAASVIANSETGIISVRATQRQHEKIREFLDRILGNARRQVLIEATIVEVDLSERFQQGIDWTAVRNISPNSGWSINLRPDGPASGLATGGLVSTLASVSAGKVFSSGSGVAAILKLLESFGNLRVLSSPKISVLNSQTSVLKVVDNEIYFTISVTPGTAATATTPAVAPTYTTTINSVPIGFLMTVTPQISDNGEVILNLRPTISRITGYAMDPSPALAEYKLNNPIPIVQTREMESIMRVQSGDIAILGGLMQDSRDYKTDEVPLVNRIPVVGELFKYKNNQSRKSELVVFLRPTVLTDASLNGDFREMRSILPEAREALLPSSARPAAATATSR
ncbi:MAG: pilus (MSHA type) biogenesis protein MshL [Betaproteobacteria bacterium]